MQTDHNTCWIRAATIRPGDRVRVPYGSRRVFASREDAESFSTPFRTVERVEPNQRFADGTSVPDAESGWVSIWFEDGRFGSYPQDAFVLRQRANGERR